MVLSFSELSDEMRPDESIWLDDEALTGHFELVKQRAEDKAGGYEQIPDMEKNELTEGLR